MDRHSVTLSQRQNTADGNTHSQRQNAASGNTSRRQHAANGYKQPTATHSQRPQPGTGAKQTTDVCNDEGQHLNVLRLIARTVCSIYLTHELNNDGENVYIYFKQSHGQRIPLCPELQR